MKITEPIKGVIHVKMSSSEALAKAFLRFQEYYESPQFKDTVFTLDEFKEWYAQKYGAFTYYTDWTGFNIPSTALEPFLKGDFDPLSPEEGRLLRAIQAKATTLESYYVIGSQEGAVRVQKHEMCHAIFYLKSGYQKQVLDLLKTYEADLIKLYYHLEELGYHASVIGDEMNAYIVTEQEYLAKKGIKVPKRLTEILTLLFEQVSESL